jgi:hypothetical protein
MILFAALVLIVGAVVLRWRTKRRSTKPAQARGV